MRHLLAMGLLSLSGATTILSAQVVQGGYRSTPAECREAANSLAGGAREGTAWDYLPGCGRTGGRALAQALQAARSETHPSYLERLYGAMASMRDPDVFAAALTVMQNEGASAQARSTAILIAVAQHDNAVGLPLNLSFADALRSGRCRLVPHTHAGYRSTTPLPADYRGKLGRALLNLSAAPGTPDLVKTFVDCTRPAMLGAIADAVPTSAIRLTYLCGNRYRVENQSTEGVQLSYQINGTKDKGGFSVPAKGTFTFTTRERGNLSLHHRGKLVQTVENGGKACPR